MITINSVYDILSYEKITDDEREIFLCILIILIKLNTIDINILLCSIYTLVEKYRGDPQFTAKCLLRLAKQLGVYIIKDAGMLTEAIDKAHATYNSERGEGVGLNKLDAL